MRQRKADLIINDLHKQWIEAIKLPDRLSLVEWAKANMYLPTPPYNVSGYFDATTSPYLVEPMNALDNTNVREVIVCGNPRGGKTLIGEALLLHTLITNPADVWWAIHKLDIVKTITTVRLMPLIEANAKRLRLSDNRFDTTERLIKFPVGSLRLCGAFNSSGFVATSGRVLIGDEVWKWTTGVLEQFKKRSDDFPYSKKILLLSQASDEGTDFHREYLSGHQAEWGFKCPDCGKEQVFVFSHRHNNGSYAGLTWDRNETTKPGGLQWNIEEASKTTRYKCINENCNKEFRDTAKERRQLNDCGMYIVNNPTANPEVKSFKWNAIATSNIRFADLTREYLKADWESKRGKYDAKKNFWLQSMSKFWNLNKAQDIIQPLVGQIDSNDSASLDCVNYMAVDVQYSGFKPYVVGSFNTVKKELHITAFGKATTFDEIEKVQTDNRVKHFRVLVDSGHDMQTVLKETAMHGREATEASGKKVVWTWLTTKGVKTKYNTFYWGKDKMGQSITQPYSVNSPKVIMYGAKGKSTTKVNHIQFAPDAMKDVLKTLLDNTHPEWKLYLSDAAKNDIDFMSQLNSEKKIPITNRNGGTEMCWRKTGATDNDYWDCMCLLTLAGTMMKYL